MEGSTAAARGGDGAPSLASDVEGPEGVSASPSAGPAEWEPGTPWRLDLGLSAGLGVRLDDAPLYPVSERAGGRFGGSLGLWLSRRISLGLGYQHLHLGGESTGILPSGSAIISRDLSTMWASLALYPFRGEQVGAFLRIAAGPTWQSGELNGSVWSSTLPDRSQTLRCEGSDSLDFALGAALGVDVTLSGALRMLANLGIDSHRLDDGPLDGCLPGAGSAMVFGLGTTVVYGIGL